MGRRRKNPFDLKLKKRTLQTISSIFLLFLAGLITLAFLGEGGTANQLQSEVFKFFGWGAFFLPLVLTIAGLNLTKLKLPFLTNNVLVGLILFLASLLSLSSALAANSGGETGNILWEISTKALSGAGAFFVLLICVVLSLVILFNTSLDTTLNLIVKSVSSGIYFVKNYLFRGYFSPKAKPDFLNDRNPVFNTKGLKPAEVSKEAKKPETHAAPAVPELEGALVNNVPMSNRVWEYPPLSILSDEIGGKAARGDLKHNAAVIEKTLESFGIQARVVEVNCGPAVTQYALEIALGTKLTKITGLANDIAMALAAPTGTVRIEAPIPGKSLVGIEVPNLSPEIVGLKHLLTSPAMQKAKSKMAIALGLDVSGEPVIGDINRMPHVLMAGATGSGKSVCLNSFIASLLFRATPNEVKLILVDPKIVELSGYNGIPHLLTPVITQPEKVLSSLKWAIAEMERRYKLFAEVGARNIEQYSEMSGFQALPYIVIIIDELADLMMFAPVEMEDSICRLAQMARATGIHLILATQRPSVDVITGLIKANIPCRIAFNVTSLVDSRVIIDQPGAEKLLGKGDMLYVPPDISKPQRIQGVYVSEPELNKLIDFLRKSGIEPQYTEEITTMPISRLSGKGSSNGGGGDERDDLFEEAVRVICQYDRASASLLQRRLRIGYARAARLLDELESAGVVGVADGSKARDVLVRDPEVALGGEETQAEE
ncbi:MAG: DNA translocase FtsK [Patescibacteria group bacterium]|nr:DNA translocase FtsK [Patescibacteria group bacterium]